MNKRIRPKQGQVLVELMPPPVSHLGYGSAGPGQAEIILPENRRLKDEIGRQPAREAIVLSCGIWPTTKEGCLIPYEFRKGSRVLVDPVRGTELRLYPKTLRLYDHTEILALA